MKRNDENQVKYLMKEKKNINNNVVDKMFQIVGNILNSLELIFLKLHPILEKFLLMEELSIFRKNGTFRDLIKLLEDISKEYKRLSLHVFNTKISQNSNDLKT